MSTYDYLLNHAYRNVWCAPGQDFQVILEPKKISLPAGARSSIKILWTTYTLPDRLSWWHVYQIGEITPELIGLGSQQNQWVRVQDHCNTQRLIADLYTKKGVQFPRFDAYLLHTRDGNMILAVKRFNAIADLDAEKLYLRLYSNAYFSTEKLDDSKEGIVVDGWKVTNRDRLLVYLARWRALKLARGHVYAFVNGYRVADLNVTTVAVGDTVEFVWDSSIKKVVELPVNALATFNSTLDKKQKFLIHFAGTSDTIDYRDDIDVFLIQRTNASIFKGVYYHKNMDDAVRMVTHRDYSLPVPYVMGYVNDIPEWTSLMSLSVVVHIRQGGLKRPLINEHQRIKELYKLSEVDRQMAMIGTESVVKEWQAANLEASPYPALMRALPNTLTLEMIEQTYGYNAISKLVADTPQIRPTTTSWIDLPVGLQVDSTLYEYDRQGKLLGWNNHYAGRQYIPRFGTCAYVEGVIGLGSEDLSTIYNRPTTHLEDRLSYRMYVCDIWNGEPSGVWTDVTDNLSYYDISNNVLTWKVDQTKFYTAVKNDLHFLALDLKFNYRDGILRFTLNVDEVRTDGVEYMGRAELPFGQLDLWLNGHSLIEDLDYFVEWPEVCIVNKAYLNEGKTQRVSVRGTGFCNADMSRDKAGEVGFVVHGLLSRNNRYDIRDDKVLRIVVDGCLQTRNQLSFSETDRGVRITQARNGAPYQITDMVVPLRSSTRTDTYQLRARSQVMDEAVSNYLSRKLPEPKITQPNPIPSLYPVFSPFTAKVMYDLIHGLVSTDDLMGQYSDVKVKEKLVQHEWLLKYEPTRRNLDLDYVSVHPHDLKTEVTLNVYQYRFLLRVIRLYLKDRVDITQFVQIEAGYEHETPDHPHPYQTAPL